MIVGKFPCQTSPKLSGQPLFCYQNNFQINKFYFCLEHTRISIFTFTINLNNVNDSSDKQISAGLVGLATPKSIRIQTSTGNAQKGNALSNGVSDPPPIKVNKRDGTDTKRKLSRFSFRNKGNKGTRQSYLKSLKVRPARDSLSCFLVER